MLRLISFRGCVTIGALLGIVGCSGSNSSPTAPTATPTIRSLNLSKASVELLVGNSERITATATYSDGSVTAASPTYTSSNTSIATVDGDGNVRAVAAGVATISATFSGATTNLSVRSIPDFAGRWSGQYRFTSCAAPPRWGESYCDGVIGPSYPIVLNLVTTGSRVVGSFQLGNVTGTADGVVAEDGTLRLNGTFAVLAANVTYSFELQNWQSQMTGNSMTGRWASLGRISGESQTAFFECEMITVSRQ
jgi:hypothetical protein